MAQQVSILAALRVNTPWSTVTEEQLQRVRARLHAWLETITFEVDAGDTGPMRGHCSIEVDRIIAKPGGGA